MISSKWKSLRQIANEALIMPKELNQQDSELQELVRKEIEKTRISTWR